MKQAGKKTVIAVCIFLAVAGIVCFAGYFTAAFSAVSPGRVIPTLTPENYRLEHENWSVDFQGQTLSAWLIPAKNGFSAKTVIFSHDRASNREIPEADGYFLMRQLSEGGYNVVTFDYLGSGNSGGDYYTFGASEKDQLSAVIDAVGEKIPGSEISLVGWGCGAAAAVYAAEHPAVKGVVAESCYETFDRSLFSAYFSLPFPEVGMVAAEAISGTDFSLSPAEKLQTLSGKYFYFIHCLDDQMIDYTVSQRLNTLAAKNNESDLWLIEGGGHCLGALADEANYPSKILLFLDSFM